eukprot:m.74704 g.74704  ORF g.74704 m.74704 type:complete len:288 (-) comp12474_c0_seq1:155-1018(-)
MSFESHGSGRGGGGYSQPRGYQVRDGDDRYLQASQKVTSSIFAITQKVQQLDKCTGFIGTKRDTQSMRDEMARVQEQTRGIIRDTGQALKMMDQMDGGSAKEKQERRLERDKLSRDFKSVLQKYQRSAQVAMDKEREYVGRARAQSHSQDYGGGGDYGQDEQAALIEEENRRKMMQTDDQIDYSSSVIEEREQSIKEIESTMMEVNEIYKDLSTLVVEQGATLDNIEANMSSVDSNVNKGVETLGQASRYQKKARSKMCCILLIVTIVLAVLVIILVTTLNKKKDKK